MFDTETLFMLAIIYSYNIMSTVWNILAEYGHIYVYIVCIIYYNFAWTAWRAEEKMH